MVESPQKINLSARGIPPRLQASLVNPALELLK